MLRYAAYALAAFIGFSIAPVSSAAAEPARCADMSFRIYFDHGSSELTPLAVEMLEAAAGNMAECAYAELHVSAEATSPRAMERGAAVMAALNGRTWDVMQIEPMPSVREVAYGVSPEFVEVTMSSTVMPETAPLTMAPRAGV